MPVGRVRSTWTFNIPCLFPSLEKDLFLLTSDETGVKVREVKVSRLGTFQGPGDSLATSFVVRRGLGESHLDKMTITRRLNDLSILILVR